MDSLNNQSLILIQVKVQYLANFKRQCIHFTGLNTTLYHICKATARMDFILPGVNAAYIIFT